MTVFKASMRNFFAHKGRMALSAIAVLLSVAFVCGTLVFTDTMNTTFDKLFSSTSPDVTVTPKKPKEQPVDGQPQAAKPRTLPASLVAKAGAVDGAKSAEGVVHDEQVTVVDGHDKNIGSTTGAPTIAGNWNRNSRKTMKITSGHAPRGAADVMVDADTAKKHHLKIGDRLRTIAATGDFTAKISGIATFQVTNPGAAIVYFDTPTAQRELLRTKAAYTQIAVAGEHGVTDALLKRNVSAALGTGDLTYQTQKESADAFRKSLGSFLNVIKYALLGFAGIALLVGIFLIVNTFSMLVAQRTREIGLMRAIGSSRGQVNRSVLIEALLLGLIGSVLGVGAGVGLAIGLMKFMGSLGMNLSTSELTLAWTTPATGLALGLLVTLLAAYLPARRAGRVSPMAALRDAGTPADGKAGTVRAVLGLLLTAGGAAGLYATTQADKAVPGSLCLAAGVVFTLLGLIVVGPVLAGGLVRVLSLVTLRPFGGRVGRLAERNALRNPRRTGATAAALMIGLALVASLSVVGSSMVASATDELDRSVGADFIVQSNNGQPVTASAEKKIKGASKTLKTVTDYKMVPTRVGTRDGASETGRLVATEPSYTRDLRRETTAGDLQAAYGKDAMSVGDEFAKKHHVHVGDELNVAFTGGSTAKLSVAAITSDDTNLDKGAMYTDISTARRHLPAGEVPPDFMMLASAKSGHDDEAYSALKKELKHYPQYQVKNQADYKTTLKKQVGGLLNLVYGLLALAIIVAVLGVVNTLALSVVERTREIGLMRAIGLARRQLRRMIRLESVVIALFGALLGLGVGMCWGAAAQKLLALEGLKVLEIPWATIGSVFVGSALVGLVAALIPAFRAGRMNVLNAIATE